MTYGVNLDYDVDYDFDAYVEVTFDLDSYNNSNWSVESYVVSEVCLDGNVANFAVDVQAFGSDTYVEANVTAITQEGKYSSVTISGTSAAS